MATKPGNLDRMAFNVLMGDPILTGIPHKSIHPFHNEDVSLWECPCRECTKLDYDVSIADDSRPMSLADFRHEQFPETWPFDDH